MSALDLVGDQDVVYAGVHVQFGQSERRHRHADRPALDLHGGDGRETVTFLVREESCPLYPAIVAGHLLDVPLHEAQVYQQCRRLYLIKAHSYVQEATFLAPPPAFINLSDRLQDAPRNASRPSSLFCFRRLVSVHRGAAGDTPDRRLSGAPPTFATSFLGSSSSSSFTFLRLSMKGI
jgi:hypothetical protein